MKKRRIEGAKLTPNRSHIQQQNYQEGCTDQHMPAGSPLGDPISEMGFTVHEALILNAPTKMVAPFNGAEHHSGKGRQSEAQQSPVSQLKTSCHFFQTPARRAAYSGLDI